jgi:hypothetical protein
MAPSRTPAGSPFAVVSFPKHDTTRRSRARVAATYSSRRASLADIFFSFALRSV